jgi:hypothetical protein
VLYSFGRCPSDHILLVHLRKEVRQCRMCLVYVIREEALVWKQCRYRAHAPRLRFAVKNTLLMFRAVNMFSNITR